MAMNLKGWSILQTFGGQNLNVHDIHREEAKAIPAEKLERFLAPLFLEPFGEYRGPIGRPESVKGSRFRFQHSGSYVPTG